MKIGILGTGVVGTTIGKKLIELNYEVMLGSRTADNEKAKAFVESNGSKASQGTFEDAAKFGEILFLCTKGDATLEILKLAKPENFKTKTVIDVSNPLDFSKGMPPSLFISNTDSLGEQVQAGLPGTNVVKTLNIVTSEVMVNPKKSNGDPTMFVCGNDASAKTKVAGILNSFGWTDIMDLGDITNARALEMMLPVWLRIFMATGNGYFAFKIVR